MSGRTTAAAALVAVALVASCAADDAAPEAPTTEAVTVEPDPADDPSAAAPDDVDPIDEPDDPPVDPEPEPVDPEPDLDPLRLGEVWERVDGDPRVFGAVPPVVTALGTGVDRAIAVGRTRDGSRALLMWISSDGRDWSVRDGAAAFGGASGATVEIRDLVARGNGFVAVGIEALSAVAGEAAEDVETVEPSDDDDQQGEFEIAEPPTVADEPVGRIRGAVWLSDDGETWERVGSGAASLEADGNVLLTAIATGGPGLIAVGSVDSGDDRHGAVWVSNDGSGWLRVPHDPAAFGESGRTSIEGLVVTPSRAVAVGVAPGIGRETRGAVWVSDDGIGWRAVPHDSTVFGGIGTSVRINAVTAGGPGFVAVGSERVPVDGALRFDAAVWWSVDGEVWERVDPADPILAGAGSQVLWDLVEADGRLVVVGGDAGAGAVWWSDDGRSWERLTGIDGVFGGVGGATQLQRVVMLGERLVAAGVSDELVPLWWSASGPD